MIHCAFVNLFLDHFFIQGIIGIILEKDIFFVGFELSKE